MFTIKDDQSIHLTRGDIASVEVSARKSETENYIFQVGDIVRFKVFEAKRVNSVALSVDIEVKEEIEVVNIPLTAEDTQIGELINKPKDYWYEVELNPDTAPQTIIGYDDYGPKIFRLYPEGGDRDEYRD